MNETENKKPSQTLVILGLLALIVALFVGIKVIFVGLEAVLPEPTQPPAQSVQMDDPGQSGSPEASAPRFCPFCGEELHDAFRWGQYCPFCGEKVEQ